MATGELLRAEEKNVTATKAPERRESGIQCPSTGLQEVTGEIAQPESAILPLGLVNIKAETFIDHQK